MSDSTNRNPDLEFDQAEFETADSSAHGSCFVCSAALTGAYFDINGKPACEACKTGIETSYQGGSRMARLLKAVVFGAIAGIGGALIYFAILKITGYEVGLVSILVGFMVGKAVFVGSGQRGGAVYQLLAISLTYLAIVSTYVPFIFDEMGQYEESDYAVEQSVATGEGTILQDVPTLVAEEPAAEVDPVEMEIEGMETQADSDVSIEQMSLLQIAAGLGLMVGVLLAMPFLAGMDNIIGLLIIGFGLFQAWTLNRKTVLTISGPFQIQSTPD